LKISIRTTHLTLAVLVNFVIAAMIGIYIHCTWMLHNSRTLGFAVFLFIAVCALSLYFWIVILWYILRPIESLIDTLYKVVHDQPPSPGEAAQNPTEIAKVSYVLKALQNNAKQIELTAKELKEQKEYLQVILEVIPDAIITIGANGLDPDDQLRHGKNLWLQRPGIDWPKSRYAPDTY
jgi:hypothetical protein